jgi:NAD(P)-dependent dehydrogenase (short-subunit alcohol dehydrogenase family)
MMFEGHVVWITGASAGIGRALALAFAEEGADVAVSARRADRLAEVTREVEARGRRALAVVCDVADEEQVEAAVSRVVEHFGRLDVAVANAGFALARRIENLSAHDWRRQLEVNVVGLAVTARHALPHLRTTKGRVALISSVTAMLPTPGVGAYGASKAAVRSIGRTLAVELHGSGVSCTTIHPGYVESELGQVDNRGVFDPDRIDRRPTRLLWPVDRAARVMVRAIYRRKREYVFTGHGKIAGFLGRHLPGLVHGVAARLSARQRRSKN